MNPLCCTECFADAAVQAIIRAEGQQGKCDFCGTPDVAVAPPKVLASFFEPLLRDYQEVTEGVHYLAALDQEADGDPLDQLLAEDNQDLFADGLDDSARQSLVQEIVDAIDQGDAREGTFNRFVDELWIRPGNELWAGAEEEYFQSAAYRWSVFVQEITSARRFFRSNENFFDPATYLTDELLDALTFDILPTNRLFRAVLGGHEDGGRSFVRTTRRACLDRGQNIAAGAVGSVHRAFLFSTRRATSRRASPRCGHGKARW